jgi:hypothetical protein
VIYNIFFSPLACIPGPLLAKVTSKWLMLIDMAGNRTSTIHKWHQMYGQTVRIGVINELYGQSSNFMKAAIYDDFSLHPVGIFSMRVKEDHRQRRKLLSHAFAQSNLLEIEPVIGDVVRQLLNRIDQNSGGVTEILTLLRLFAFDVVGKWLRSRN